MQPMGMNDVGSPVAGCHSETVTRNQTAEKSEALDSGSARYRQ